MRHYRLIWLAMTAICLVVFSEATAKDWTEFRGPTGQGLVESTLPTKWSTTEHVTWKREVPGKGWSSPIIHKGHIYLTTAVPEADKSGNSLRALCLDVKTGQKLWDREVFKQTDPATLKIHGKNSHASSSPITDGEFLFVHFGNSGTACLTLDGKTVVWRNNELKYKHVHGNGSSPVLVDDLVIVNCDGGDLAFVAALDRKTGQLRWKRDRPPNSANKFAFSTPLIIEVAGAKQVVSAGAGSVVAYRPKDGEPIWHAFYPRGYSVVPRPVFGHGLIFVSSGYDSPVILAITPDGKGDVTETHVKWRLKKSGPRNASPLLVGDELYIVSDDGVAQCVDAKSGKVHWQHRLGGKYSASPIAADGKVYFFDEEGQTIIIEASTTFHEIARNTLAESGQGGYLSLASPAADGSSLFIRTHPSDNDLLWRIDP